MIPLLDELGLLEGTDKNSLTHGYLRHYERVVGPLRDEPITLLEIGVDRGGSLRTWLKYFTRATIVGVDIRPECAEFATDRCIIEIGSQADPAFLTRLGAKHRPTIVIDDGSHLADHILLTFEMLFPALLPGGTYIVEDVHFHVGPKAADFRAYFLNLANGAAFDDQRVAADPRFIHHIDTVEFWHGGIAIRKRRDSEPDRIAEKRRLVERANLPEIWGSFAMYILQEGGDPRDAVAAARRSAEMRPSEAVRHYHLSLALERAGDAAGAMDEARAAAALDPDFAPFRKRIAELERR
jgi:hypothetical protein